MRKRTRIAGFRLSAIVEYNVERSEQYHSDTDNLHYSYQPSEYKKWLYLYFSSHFLENRILFNIFSPAGNVSTLESEHHNCRDKTKDVTEIFS